MRISIRRKVFETNSSSVHSAVILSPENKQKYLEGGLVVTEEVGEVIREKLDLEVGDIISCDQLVEGFKDKELRSLLESNLWSKSVDEILDEEDSNETERLKLFRYNGFWSTQYDSWSEIYRKTADMETPDGEKVFVICYNGFS